MRTKLLQPPKIITKILLLFALAYWVPVSLIAQETGGTQRVTGKVIDRNGEALPGANVLIKGTSEGTITDAEGNYSISANPSDTLSFSYIGYGAENVPVNNQTQISITLIEDISQLEDVVVIGYGTVKKTDLTGSVSSVEPSDLYLGPAANIDQALTGKMAGVQINQNSAQPGGSVNVRIRGANSINASSSPLYVIDGLPIDNSPAITGSGTGVSDNRNPPNPLNLINPNDIQSIEVLKDASATAIYGSRGANGVIIITTKNGQQGKTNVNYDFSGGIQEVARKVDMLSATEFATVVNDIRQAQGGNPLYDLNEVEDTGDWLDEVTRRGYIQNHNLSVSGGNDKNTFYSSINYFDQQGIVISSGLERLTARLNARFRPNDKFTYGVNLTNSYTNNDNVPFGTGFNASAGIINSALELDPTLPKFNDDGTPYQADVVDMDNPLMIARVGSEEQTTRILGTAFGEYAIIPDLLFKINLGFDRVGSRKDTYIPSNTKVGINNGSGIATIITGEQSSRLFESTLTYNKSVSNHNLTLLGGFTWQNFVNRGFSGNLDGFTTDAVQTNNLALGSTENDNLNSYKNSNQLISYLGRVNYNFQQKYYLTASVRADGSSRFGENNKFAIFPSFALSWRLSEEPFMSDLEFISNLKLRTSWGQTGNQEIGNYASLATLGAGGLALLGNQQVIGFNPIRIPNPDLKWETTTQLDIGVDLELFEGRIDLVADYFVKNTDDLLLNLPLPKSSGYNSILSNVGSVENKGVEVLLNTRNVVGSNFSWSSTLTYTQISNQVTSLGDIDGFTQGGLPFTADITIVQEGSPLNSYYGMIVDGIWQEGDDIENSAQPSAQPGFPKFRDISGPNGEPDGVISSDDKTTIGSPFPDFSLGFRNSFSYKRFGLDIFFAGDFGQELLNQNLLYAIYPIEERRNRLAVPSLNRWTPQNPTNKWPSGVNPDTYGGSTVNSLSVEDATFFRLRNVRLNYTLNTEAIRFLSAVNVYFQGDNLLLFTDYLGFDPEVNSLDNRSNSARADYNAYPNARTYTVGCQITF
ncbi:MAG: TonB-dependent receptor [Cyclobacteriaceae bacterium]|jgi:TonB-linked SusC/RagA family outer membrane protein